MRGDVEVLAFNMLHWLATTLPWETLASSNTKNKELEVQKMKVKFMDSISESLAAMKLDKQSNGNYNFLRLSQFCCLAHDVFFSPD
jgi:hypothetical protein